MQLASRNLGKQGWRKSFPRCQYTSRFILFSKCSGFDAYAQSYLHKILCWIAAICETTSVLHNNFPDPVERIVPRWFLDSPACSIEFAPALTISSSYILGWWLIVLGSYFRYAAYHELGNSFTLELGIRSDHKLITSGPYFFVRHPSYTGILMAAVGGFFCHLSDNSWAIQLTHIYADLINFRSYPSVPGVASLQLHDWLRLSVLAILLLTGYGLSRRIEKEEEMLADLFGEEWKTYIHRVPFRFIPGLL